MAVILLNLGSIHSANGQLPRAIEYYRQAIAESQRMQRPDFVRHGLANLGIVFQSLGRQDSAIHYFVQVTRLSEEAGNQKHIVNSYLLLARSYSNYNRLDKALEYTHKTIGTLQQMGGEANSLSSAHRLAADLYVKTGREELALQHADSALVLARSLNNQVAEAASQLLQLKALRGLQRTAEANAIVARLQALPHEPTFAGARRYAWWCRGEDALNAGQADSAAVYLQRALALVPSNGSNELLANLYMGQAIRSTS